MNMDKEKDTYEQKKYIWNRKIKKRIHMNKKTTYFAS